MIIKDKYRIKKTRQGASHFGVERRDVLVGILDEGEPHPHPGKIIEHEGKRWRVVLVELFENAATSRGVNLHVEESGLKPFKESGHESGECESAP